MHSLKFKWLLTLLLTSLVGVVLIGLVARFATGTELERFVFDQAQANFTADITRYYQQNGSLQGVAMWFRENNTEVEDEPEDGVNPPRFGLANRQGRVIIGLAGYPLGTIVPQNEIGNGTPLVINGEEVGTILLNRQAQQALDPLEERYLNAMNRALVIGSGGAALMALLVGLLMTETLMRPLRELTKAIRAVRQGNLQQTVPVRSKDELGELANAFNQMSAELAQANHLRRQMTADIAHDLRTPLTVITGYLEALQDGSLRPNQERFETMYNEALQLQRLIDDLRTLSLADAGELKLVYQRVHAKELLEQVQHSFQDLAAKSHIQLAVDAPPQLPSLNMDKERMIQVLANLTSNALRYTPRGGAITLAARQAGQALELIVHDTGAGIPADKLPYIFERFYRVDEARQQTGKESGLGLAIAKSIVTAHHGTIHAASQVGRGTSMIIQLPL